MYSFFVLYTYQMVHASATLSAHKVLILSAKNRVTFVLGFDSKQRASIRHAPLKNYLQHPLLLLNIRI